MDARNVAENCATNAPRNCQPMTSDASPWHPESERRNRKQFKNDHLAAKYDLDGNAQNDRDFCRFQRSVCNAIHHRNADGRWTKIQWLHYKTMQNTSVINDDLLVLNFGGEVLATSPPPQRNARTGQSASKQWTECASDLTLFLGLLYLGCLWPPEKCLTAHPTLYSWRVCARQADRCLWRNLNSGPIRHFDGIYGTKCIRLFLFSRKWPTHTHTKTSACVRCSSVTESRTQDNHNGRLRPLTWPHTRMLQCGMTCIPRSSSASLLISLSTRKVVTKKCAQYQKPFSHRTQQMLIFKDILRALFKWCHWSGAMLAASEPNEPKMHFEQTCEWNGRCIRSASPRPLAAWEKTTNAGDGRCAEPYSEPSIIRFRTTIVHARRWSTFVLSVIRFGWRTQNRAN